VLLLSNKSKNLSRSIWFRPDADFFRGFFQRRRPVPSAFAARLGSVRGRPRTIPETIDGFSRYFAKS
jgi:hypothetical protein